MAVYYEMIRKKKQENNGRLMNTSDIDVVREIVNNDMPKAKEEAIEEANKMVDQISLKT